MPQLDKSNKSNRKNREPLTTFSPKNPLFLRQMSHVWGKNKKFSRGSYPKDKRNRLWVKVVWEKNESEQLSRPHLPRKYSTYVLKYRAPVCGYDGQFKWPLFETKIYTETCIPGVNPIKLFYALTPLKCKKDAIAVLTLMA